MAHQNVLACWVGLVSFRCSAHPLYTFASPTAHFSSLSLTHYSGTASLCSLTVLFSWLLVHPVSSILSSLGDKPQHNERASELTLWGAKLNSEMMSWPFSQLLCIKPCLLLSLFLFVFFYLFILFSLFCQLSCSMLLLLSARQSCTLFLSLFFFFSVSILLTHFTVFKLLSVPSAMLKKKFLKNFFQCAYVSWVELILRSYDLVAY